MIIEKKYCGDKKLLEMVEQAVYNGPLVKTTF